MATMRFVDIKGGTGHPDALFINEGPRPKPNANQCLIKVKAFGLNRADCLQREGLYPMPPGIPTTIMGLEFAGVIAEVGHGSEEEERHNFQEGDEVFGLAYGGCYAEYVAINKKMIIRKPPQIDWTTAAGIPETWFTALQALYIVGEYKPEQTKAILWHACASSVAIAGIQLSKAANEELENAELPSHSEGLPPPKVYGTARQDEKCDFAVQKLGADKAFNTEKEDWSKAIVEANGGQGVDLLIDFVGASYFQKNLETVGKDSKIVLLGTMGGVKLGPDANIGPFLAKRIRFEGSTLRSRSPDYQGRIRDIFEKKALPQILSDRFETHTDTVLPWEKIGEAHEKLEKNLTKGKVVCTIS